MIPSKSNKPASKSVERKTSVKLTREEQSKLIPIIQDFFRQERNEEIEIIAAMTVLDFFLENLGMLIHNKTLEEAKIWFSRRMEDIEIDFDMLYK